MKSAKLVLLIAILWAVNVNANNLQISNISLSGQNTVQAFNYIGFDISWNNSWRTNVGPSNFDAAWVFAKYRLKNSSVWNHATLNWVDGTGTADGHTFPSQCSVTSTNDNNNNGATGAFIYSNSVMLQQNVYYNNLKLRWNYGVDGVLNSDSVEICLFGVEMVYVPDGSFYVGDGTSSIKGQFRNQASNTPFLITSENALTLGGNTVGSLNNNNASAMTTPDDWNNATSKSLPASFPKGFNGYFVMKYEITQEQYAEFLNKLTRTQQLARVSSNAVGSFMCTAANQLTPLNRNGVKLIFDPGLLQPFVFGNDLNNNNTAGEDGDGQSNACNFLSSTDLMAFLDWSGLRPITELEFEKACRGSQTPVIAELAWGSSVIVAATTLSNAGKINEGASNANANCVYGNNAGVNGPMRTGNFATSASNRVAAGASYLGIMELTGNVWEDVVTVGSNAGRSFTGLHGNGTLNNAGAADVNFWPGINGNSTSSNTNNAYGGVTGCTGNAGISFTGGSWRESTYLQVSDRDYRGVGYTGINNRDTRNGGRGVKTVPGL